MRRSRIIQNSPPEQIANTVTGDTIQLEILKILKSITHEMKSLKEHYGNGKKKQRGGSSKNAWDKKKTQKCLTTKKYG